MPPGSFDSNVESIVGWHAGANRQFPFNLRHYAPKRTGRREILNIKTTLFVSALRAIGPESVNRHNARTAGLFVARHDKERTLQEMNVVFKSAGGTYLVTKSSLALTPSDIVR